MTNEIIDKKTELFILTKESIKEKIYEIRGEKVMLDFELAEIYGYETKNFNRQVRNNIEKFEGFIFQLTIVEVNYLARCKKFTSRIWTVGNTVAIIPTNNRFHDRYIIIDDKDYYLCGSSSKDSGNKITTIVKLDNNDLSLLIKKPLH